METVKSQKVSPDRMDARAAMMKDKITPGPAISLATSPATTYMPVPTQLPTPSDTRSTVVSTRASLVPCRSSELSCMESRGLVRRIREWSLYQDDSHSILLGSSLAKTALIVQHRKTRIKEGWDLSSVSRSRCFL